MRPSLALAAVAASIAVGCTSANDRRLNVETWPQGASVRVGDRIEGQTPLPGLHVVVPKDGYVVLLIEKDGYQTVAYPLDEKSPDRLFFSLELAPDLERIGAAVKSLQATVESLGSSLSALRTSIERSGQK